MNNYTISYEARKLSARAWKELQGKIESYDGKSAIDLFEELKSIDENFYEYNICKLLCYRNDKDVALFGNSKFGPTQFIVAHSYRKGKGVEENIGMAKQHYEMGLLLGNIICFSSLYSMFPLWKKILFIPILLINVIRFAYIRNRNEFDTRVLY